VAPAAPPSNRFGRTWSICRAENVEFPSGTFPRCTCTVSRTKRLWRIFRSGTGSHSKRPCLKMKKKSPKKRRGDVDNNNSTLRDVWASSVYKRIRSTNVIDVVSQRRKRAVTCDLERGAVDKKVEQRTSVTETRML